MKIGILSSAMALSLVIAASSAVYADGPSTRGAIPDIESILGPLPSQSPRRFPAIFGAPSAVGAEGGTGFVALTLVNPREGISGNGTDGDMSVGYTIGDAVDSISLTFGVGVTSLEGFGDDGAFFLSASRRIGASENSSTYVGLQAGNLLAWGDADEDDEKLTVSLSHLTSFGTATGSVPVQFSVGYGDDNTVENDGTGASEDGAIIGLGVGLTEYMSGSISATETQVNLGVGFTIPSLPSVGFSAGVFDVSDNTDRRQFSATAAFSF